MSKYIRLLPILALALLIHGCGGGQSATAVINGQAYQLEVSGTDCVVPPSYDGFSAPLVCSVFFRTAGFFSDVLQISVTDVRPIYDQLGYWQKMKGGLVDGFLTLQGQEQSIYDGQVMFTDISNVAGNRVCAKYQIVTGDGQVEGDFCGRVRVGY